MRRVPEVIDCWFDSGSMPVAQWHYPFENQEMFKAQFPADYICEAVDQTRGWFYSLHAISTMLFDQPCFKNVICLGLILDAEGQKMSKSKGNVVSPWDVVNAHGADALRWYLYTATPPGNERRFSTRPRRRGRPQFHADAVEHVLVLCDLRQSRQMGADRTTTRPSNSESARPVDSE